MIYNVAGLIKSLGINIFISAILFKIDPIYTVFYWGFLSLSLSIYNYLLYERTKLLNEQLDQTILEIVQLKEGETNA